MVIILKELVILPNQEIKIEIKSKLSQEIIKKALNLNSEVLVIAPINTKEESPNTDDLPKIAVLSLIKNKIDLTNGNIRVTLKGLKRVVVIRYYNHDKNEDILYGLISDLKLPKYKETEEIAIIRKLKQSLKRYISSSDNISNSIISSINKNNNIDTLTDLVTVFLPFNNVKKLNYMQNINPLKRANDLLLDIEEEIEINKIENELNDKLNKKFNDNQKEYILKEKLKEIKTELGESSFKNDEVVRYQNILNSLNLNKQTKKKLEDEIKKYDLINEESPECSLVHNYLETILTLPWNNASKENDNTLKIRKELDTTHFGLKEVKDRIIEYVSIKKISNKVKDPILCFIGPPGVGKTTIAMSIAQALNREFVKISVGGLNDSTELIGSRRTYLGANPGKIIQGIKKCNYNNPVMLIDEVDKMVKDYKGDPASTLLEILDQGINSMFIDNYLEEPFDLSKVMFILTANNEEDIPYALYDRLEIINLYSYSIFDKEKIANNYLLPKIYDEYNFKPKMKFSLDLIKTIINHYTYENGVRDLDRVLRNLIRKIIVMEPNIKIINKDNIKKIIGEYKFDNALKLEDYPVGRVNSLVKLSIGGSVLYIEGVKTKGNGFIETTGNLGLIVTESVSVAKSYLETNYKLKFNDLNIHLHFLGGAIKKDGPSAGMTITTVLLSLLLNKKVDSKIAFTGEMSLNGDIYPVGALKEKLIAAYNFGITKVYIPYGNTPDLSEIDEKILKKISVVAVKSYNEIYNDLFKS